MPPLLWRDPLLRLQKFPRQSFSALQRTTQCTRTFTTKIEANHYRVLGLDAGATQADIKKAFFELSRAYHPDKNAQNAKAHQKYARITEAYTVLKDPAKRRLYDEHIASGRPQSSFTGGGSTGYTARAYDPNAQWAWDRYGHRPEFHGAQSGGGQRRNRFSNMAIVGFTFVFMAVGAVIQMARFNAHYESTASNLQAMNDEVARVYAKTREDAYARGYKEQIRQLREKSGSESK